MTAFLKKLNYGFDLFRLWLVLVPLQIVGFVMLVAGVMNLSSDGALQNMFTGALMLAAAAFVRRRIQALREGFNAAGVPDVQGSLKELLEAAAKMKAKTSSASQSVPAGKKSAPTPRAGPVRRSPTVTRAGWI